MKTTDYHSQSTPGWMMQAPVINTGHMLKSDDDRLRADERRERGAGPIMADLQPGWLLLIEDFAHEFKGHSDAFLHLLETFHNLGFHYLRLDPEGDVLEDLPRFEW